MPTGYTEIVYKGATFEEFVWRNVRAMGACATMRDEPLDAVIPLEFQLDPYYQNKITEVQEQIETLQAMSQDDIYQAMQDERNQGILENQRRLAKHNTEKAFHDRMMEQVINWKPPTAKHESFKWFMIEQLDMGESYCYQAEIPPIDPVAWFRNKLAESLKRLECFAGENAMEVERTNKRNQWLAELRKSVPQPTKAPCSKT